MYIKEILELSTAHLTKNTAERMDNHQYCIARYAYGALVYVDPWQIEHRNVSEYPKDLLDCIALALDNNCDYILFDQDEEPIKELATYDW